jgi:protein-S-isoprenylcysteine O-methyltransferase Ste14
MGRVRISEADICYSHVGCAAARGLRRRTVIERVLLTFAPAALLGWLGVVQAVEAFRGGLLLTANPSWPIAVEVVREILYGSFVFGAAVTLWIRRDARARDGRGRVIAASHCASFLLVGVGLLPTGPVLWAASNRVSETCLIVTVLGAALALVALTSLGSHFSIVPEARSLVVTGPYRWLRHPMYFAEFLMIVGLSLGGLCVTYLIGAVSVLLLQIYRIIVEERLLSTTFPTGYEEFVAHTRYRLIPLVW